LSKQHARGGLSRWVGQGRGDTADKTRIVHADIDFNTHEAPARHPRAVAGD
jgi:hypothetical protein